MKTYIVLVLYTNAPELERVYKAKISQNPKSLDCPLRQSCVQKYGEARNAGSDDGRSNRGKQKPTRLCEDISKKYQYCVHEKINPIRWR